MAKLDTEAVVRRFKEAHGDRYDYSKVEYVNSVDKVIVICPTHGEYHVRAILHWKGQECLKCSGVVADWSGYLQQFLEVHGNKYDYSKSVFTSRDQAIIVICPDHGEFSVQPVNHRKPSSGCRPCAHSRRVHDSSLKVIDKFRLAHGDMYSYEKFRYTGALDVSTITCLKHGDFYMTPGNHYQGHGCPSCWQNTASKPEIAWMQAISDKSGWLYLSSPKVQNVVGVADSLFQAGLDKPVVIEYDGNYWHSREKSMTRDVAKTQQLADSGHYVVRLRVTGAYSLEDVPNATLNIPIPEKPSDEAVLEIISKIKDTIFVHS